MRTYLVKEIFYSLQGEAFHAGRPAVFLRFSGCNGWSGLEPDRGKGPLSCSAFCDTDFLGINGTHGGKYHAAQLASEAASLFAGDRDHRFVILTGGEPALQVDGLLIDALHRFGFEIAIETNGTRELPSGIDWVTVSPKVGLPLVVTTGSELKLIYPQEGVDPGQYSDLTFSHRYLQPCDGPDLEANTKAAISYCLANPRWKLSVQLHKVIGVR